MKRNIKSLSIMALAISFMACQDEIDYYNARETDPAASIADSDLVLDGKTESAVITMETNMWWTAEVAYDGTSEDWCRITPESGYGNVEITVTSTRNYQLSSDRIARIIVKGDDRNTSFTKEFIVTQKASSPYIDIDNLKGKSIEVPVVRSVNKIVVKSNSAWTASSNQDWCTVTADGDSGEIPISVECAMNKSGQVREAVIEIKSKNDDGLTESFKVIQDHVFGTTVVTVEKTPSAFGLSWTPVVGSAGYQVLVRKLDGEVEAIDAGTQTSIDLAGTELFGTPEYAGWVALSVKTLSEDPDVFSVSQEHESNSHFTSGKGLEADPFIIGDIESLGNITKANKVLGGAYYKLAFTPEPGTDFTPICSYGDPFAGVFDGNGATISNWKPTVYVDRNTYFGFFGAVASGARISDLKFKDCQFRLTNDGGSISSDTSVGFLSGTNNGEITNVEISNCSIATDAGTSPLFVGAVSGQNSGTISSCHASGGRISAASDRNKSDKFQCGGITGYNKADGVVENCENGNEIIAMDIIGGIAGYNDGIVSNCGNSGKITANYYFGGIVGYVKTTGKGTFRIENCWNTGTIVMDEPSGFGRGAAYMGGIISRLHSTGVAVKGCWNSGDMIVGSSASGSNMRVGGIVGHVNNTGILTDCYFSGNVTIAGKANYGGIVGEFADKATKVVNCYSVGKVTKADSASGEINDAFGKGASKPVISSCYALSNGGDSFAGGTTTGVGPECGYKTASELQNQNTFSGWDFTTIWVMNGYPTLRQNPAK